jgi:putative MATE family efflux protein
MTPQHLLISGPILPTMLRMSWPNMIAMLATAAVTIAETMYVGQLGTAPLAGMALVFPVVMLQHMLSAGGIGGGISATISRAMGAQDTARAQALAWHGCVLCLSFGVLFTVLLTLGIGAFLNMLGGQADAVASASRYAYVAFGGCTGIWLTNGFASVLRATGDMRTPSATLMVIAVVQVLLSGALGLGWGPFPRLGMAGVASGLALAYAGGAVFLGWRLTRAQAPLRLSPRTKLAWPYFQAILKIGGLGSLSSIQNVLYVLIVTRLVAGFGTEALAGYGIGSRLEFLLVPITFAIGVSAAPLVGMALGAGLVARARRVAWTGAALAMLILAPIGFTVALWPNLWSGLFTDDPVTLGVAASYFQWVGPVYIFFGAGLALYFAAQGAGKLAGPVLVATLRLCIVAVGGWWLLKHGADAQDMFALIGVAMAVYGVCTALSVWRTKWQ